MPERRLEPRPDSPDRRREPRPSLRLNLIILLVAVVIATIAIVHRARINSTFSQFVIGSESVSTEVAAVRRDFLNADLTEQQLRSQLRGRLEYADSLESQNFFLSVHPTEKVLRFNYGDTVVREAPLTVGPPLTVDSPDGTWTFAQYQGASHVERKLRGYVWKPQPWVYRMKGSAAPAEISSIENGLGKYVIELPNGYLIHSPPAEESPLDGPKPASFMVPEEDLAAIWPRIQEGTDVFVF